MRYRLDEKHYYLDMLLEPGTEVGDETGLPWRDAKGSPLPPSRAMTPLDDEAKKLYEKHFGGVKPDVDPTKAIPVMANVKQSANVPIRPVAPGVKA